MVVFRNMVLAHRCAWWWCLHRPLQYRYRCTRLHGVLFSLEVNSRHTALRTSNFNLHHHHHHVQEGLGLIRVPCIFKMKLVPPSLPWSSFSLQTLQNITVCLCLIREISDFTVVEKKIWESDMW